MIKSVFVYMRIKKYYLLTLLLTTCSLLLNAQKVGVVLSGGGAKGLYHIGILKALEENGIPVDYISGTSMGSIVAGLYAAGYSPTEMEALFMGDKVPRWLTGKIEDRYYYYYKKLDARPSMVNLDIDIKKYISKSDKNATQKKKISLSINKADNSSGNGMLPASLIPSIQIDMAFLDLAAGASAKCKNNFDSLFVPFRCVSVDIVDKKEYVWSKGDLATAMRSSMAIPLVFSPIMIDSMIMYDGGLMNNFPWKNMQDDFSPDIIIGGKCISGNPDIKTLPGQVEMLLTSRTDYNLPDSLGVMISRDIDVGMLDYKKAEYIINLGYNDALMAIPEIKERVARRVNSDTVANRRLAFKSDIPELVFDKFSISGLKNSQKQYFLSQIKSDIPKDTILDFEQFKTNYFKILSSNNISGGMPSAHYNDTTGYFGLDVKLYNKPGLKVLVGLNISSTSVNQGYVGLQYNRTGEVNSLYLLDGYIGSYHSGIRVSARYDYHRKRAFYVGTALTYNFFDYARGNSQRIAYKNTNLGHSRFNDLYASALIGKPLGVSSKLELRGAIGYDIYGYYLKNAIVDFDSNPDKTSMGFFNMNLAIKRNSLNFEMYPTRGLYQKISLFGNLYNERYSAGTISLSTGMVNEKTKGLFGGMSFKREDYISISKHFNFGYYLECLYMNKPKYTNSTFAAMALPGFTPTSHSKTIFMPEFHNSSYIGVGIIPIVELNNNMYCKTEAYAYKANIGKWGRTSDKIKYIISSSLVYQSPIGPVSFNYSHYAISGIKRDYFTFNIGYLLFNKKGIQY